MISIKIIKSVNKTIKRITKSTKNNKQSRRMSNTNILSFLPKTIVDMIYSYDNTARENFNQVLPQITRNCECCNEVCVFETCIHPNPNKISFCGKRCADFWNQMRLDLMEYGSDNDFRFDDEEDQMEEDGDLDNFDFNLDDVELLVDFIEPIV
jgi:hypothetical protein